MLALARRLGAVRRASQAVLGIESSCDDTGAAVVLSSGRILAQRLAGQEALHAGYGGVVPRLAAEAHRQNCPLVVERALADAQMAPGDLAAVAVTVGPGLSPCLHAGVETALRVARDAGVGVVPVNHLQAHVLSARLEAPDLAFPFVTLLLSGGHSCLVVAHAIDRYEPLGQTRDDSLGEALDKAARLIGLTGGGREMEALAATVADETANPFRFPVPLRGKPGMDFSFSGLKCAMHNTVRRHLGDTHRDVQQRGGSQAQTWQRVVEQQPFAPRELALVSRAFQQAAFQHVLAQTRKALAQVRPSALVLCGGVAANQTLRAAVEAVCAEHGASLVCPSVALSTDNGAMIAWAAIEQMRHQPDCVLPADQLRSEELVRVRWPLQDLGS